MTTRAANQFVWVLTSLVASYLLGVGDVHGQPPPKLSGTSEKPVSQVAALKLDGNETPLAIQYSPNGELLGVLTTGGVRIWNLKTGSRVSIDQIFTYQDSRLEEVHFRFSPDNAYLAVATGNAESSDNQLQFAVWSVTDGKRALLLDSGNASDGQEPVFAFSPSGKLFSSVGTDNVIVVNDLARGKSIARLNGHTGSIGALAFSADEKELFSAASDPIDGTIRRWEVATPQESQILIEGRSTTALLPTADGKSLLIASTPREHLEFRAHDYDMGREVTQWSFANEGVASLVMTLPETANSLELGADGNAVYLQEFNKVAVWDPERLRLAHPAMSARVNYLPDDWRSRCLSRDKKTFATINRYTICIWDVHAREPRMQWDHPTDAGVPSISGIAPDGSELAIYYDSGEIRRMKPRGTLPKPKETVSLNSAVRNVHFVQGDEMLAIDLIANESKSGVWDFGLDVQAEAEAYARIEQPLQEERDKFYAARDRERNKLIGRLRAEKKLSLFQREKESPAELRDFDAETSKLEEQKIGIQRQKPLADLHNRLWDKQGKEHGAPWGEIVALWRPSAAKPEMIISQPRFTPEEFKSYVPTNYKIEQALLEDPTRPIRGSVYRNDSPGPLIHNDRIIWWDRLKNNLAISVASRDMAAIGDPALHVRAWKLSPDGKVLFVEGVRTADTDKEKRGPFCALLHLETNKWVPLSQERIGILQYLKVCFTPDNRRLFVHMHPSERDYQKRKSWVFQIDIATGADVGTPIPFPEEGFLRSLTISPDGQWLSLIYWKNKEHLSLINLATFKERAVAIPKEIKLLVFSPDSKNLAVVITHREQTTRNELMVIDVATGETRARAQGWSTFVHALAYSPNSQIIAVGGGGWENSDHQVADSREHHSGIEHGELRLFDARNGKTLAPLVAHDGLVTCLAFDKSGSHLVSGSLDRTVKVWDMAPFLSEPGQSSR